MEIRKAVIFDLDGTLTLPTLDFDRIRARVGISDGPVLEALEQTPPTKRVAAQAVLMLGDRQPPDYADRADRIIRSLPELILIVDP